MKYTEKNLQELKAISIYIYILSAGPYLTSRQKIADNTTGLEFGDSLKRKRKHQAGKLRDESAHHLGNESQPVLMCYQSYCLDREPLRQRVTVIDREAAKDESYSGSYLVLKATLSNSTQAGRLFNESVGYTSSYIP